MFLPGNDLQMNTDSELSMCQLASSEALGACPAERAGRIHRHPLSTGAKLTSTGMTTTVDAVRSSRSRSRFIACYSSSVRCGNMDPSNSSGLVAPGATSGLSINLCVVPLAHH